MREFARKLSRQMEKEKMENLKKEEKGVEMEEGEIKDDENI